MSTREDTAEKPHRRIRVPRWAGFLLGLFVALVIYPVMVDVLPWGISLYTPRYGWTENGPGTVNLWGLIGVVLGSIGLFWVFAVMLAQISRLPRIVELEWTAQVLITHGPFAYSRNPMFLSGLIVWLGWALFYGSPVLLLIALVLWLLSHCLKVPREERALEARFGETYRDYTKTVCRWLGRKKARTP